MRYTMRLNQNENDTNLNTNGTFVWHMHIQELRFVMKFALHCTTQNPLHLASAAAHFYRTAAAYEDGTIVG